jgi:hypothetical protein
VRHPKPSLGKLLLYPILSHLKGEELLLVIINKKNSALPTKRISLWVQSREHKLKGVPVWAIFLKG